MGITDPSITPPAGFRLRTWEYPEGTPRHGLVCNGCGGVPAGIEPEPGIATSDDLAAAAARHSCYPPAYEWDFWHRRARERGVDPELAELGREVYREAYQHAWEVTVDGESMIRSALRSPAAARRRWSRMLHDDNVLGLRPEGKLA